MSAKDYNESQIERGLLVEDQLLYLVERAGRAVQEEKGLVVDGMVGPKTRAAIEEIIGPTVATDNPLPIDGDHPPIPRRRNIEDVYGKFSYREGERGRIIVTDDWADRNIHRLTLHTGQKLQCHKKLTDMYALYEEACKQSGYTPKRIGSYVPRHTMWDPSRSLSTHAWGVAFDIDSNLNGYGKTDTRLRQDARSMLFVKVFEDAGWTWGGRWRTPDDMHFQRVRS